MDFCPKCNMRILHQPNCNCIQFDLIRHAGDWQNPEQIWTTDHESAALLYAEDYDSSSGEYIFVNGGGDIYVRQTGLTEIKKFHVSGEAVPQYYALEATTPTDGSEGR
jgi:dihydrofolate reductase